MSYCKYVKTLDKDNLHRIYHNKYYGVRIKDDNELFGRLILEINQAGLSWNTILNKENNFRKAYNDFDINIISNYKDKDIKRLLGDVGIIRNNLKILAVINNANIIKSIQKEYKDDKSGFYKWIRENNFKDIKVAIKVFKKKGFKFVGGEILSEFLMSIGEYKSAHESWCDKYRVVR